MEAGQILIFDRTAKGKSFGEIGGPGGWSASEMTLALNQSVQGYSMPVWKFPYVPMLVDRNTETQEWFVVATFYDCTSWYDLGRPDLPYIQYNTREGTWEKAPLDERLFDHKANLMTGIRSGGEPSFVTLAEKNERGKCSGAEYRSIIRTWQTGC